MTNCTRCGQEYPRKCRCEKVASAQTSQKPMKSNFECCHKLEACPKCGFTISYPVPAHPSEEVGAKQVIQNAYQDVRENDELIIITERGLENAITDALRAQDAKARKEERERCAKIAENFNPRSFSFNENIAAAIRRGGA